jgi:dienelactone hydrolase
MMKNNADSLSPSSYHRRLMDALVPSDGFKGGAVGPWQRTLRRKVKALVNLDPLGRPALNTRRLWRREHPLGTIEKVVFTCEQGADMPAYVCLPASAKPPYTFMICLQGHTSGMHHSLAVKQEDETQPMEVAGDRDFALGCMKRGIAAICLEQRSFGERKEKRQEKVAASGCHDAAMHALMLGKTLMGERVYDVDRAIDYLVTRADADPARIGVMGNSGGGTISLFSAALLPRIAFAMPSCYFCTFRDSIMSIYHCADNYVPGLLKVAEMPDIMGLFAPKPVVLVAGKTDEIFPLPGVRKAFRHLRGIYAAAGAADRCHLVVGPEGHRFYADLAWPVMLKELKRLEG